MIYSVKGFLRFKRPSFFVVEVGGLAFKINSSANALKSLPREGEIVNVFTYLHVREDALELYGFLDEAELNLFLLLIGISGIGPKSALSILGIDKIEKLKSAIIEGRPELLTKASGIGKKTADRIILELRTKLKQEGAGRIVGLMESDQDIIEALCNLGYARNQAREALSKIDSQITAVDERIKLTLKLLKKN